MYKQGKQRNFAGEKFDQCDLSRVTEMNIISDGTGELWVRLIHVQFPVYSAFQKPQSNYEKKQSDKHRLKDSLCISDQYLQEMSKVTKDKECLRNCYS